jgi:peptidoglycan/xylan/chitin deacetylase (PgdA/CDA1 family)
MKRTRPRALLAAVTLALTATVLTPISSLRATAAQAADSALAGGMWMLGSDGGVFTLAGAPFEGSLGNVRLNAPVVSMAATVSGRGYWIAAVDGGVFSFGDASFHGSTGAMHLNRPIVGISPTPSGHGYWLVASDGGIFSFGDARFSGSTGGLTLNRPIVGMASTPPGHGYWLVASDGGVFTFGDAHYYGSRGGQALSAAVIGIARTDDARGYWITTRNGTVAAFGDAHNYGNRASVSPTAGVVPTQTGDGYWVAAQDGGVATAGAAGTVGSARSQAPIITVATRWASSGSGANLVAAPPPRPTGRTAALTFDDGPNPTYTPQILGELASAGVPAAFFTVGNEGVLRPDLLRAEASGGHSVEDHTWDHADLTTLTPAAVTSELERTADLIQQATGVRPVCFRPPYEATNPTVVSIAAGLGLSQTLWNVDPTDWKRPGAGVIVNNVLTHATGQSIVVILHDGGGDRSQTVAALPAIIAGLRARGYQFVRLCS